MEEINKDQIMKCGHKAIAFVIKGNTKIYHCPICIGTDAFEQLEKLPSLEGRQAQCFDCRRLTQSNFNLPFFKYESTKAHDSYYCGCCGWD